MNMDFLIPTVLSIISIVGGIINFLIQENKIK